MGELVVAVVGLSSIILGLFQYMQNQDKENDTRRQGLFSELEQTKLANITLKGGLAREKRLHLGTKSKLRKCRRAYLRLQKKQ